MVHTPHVAVVGAGPGGYTAAFFAADLGMRVTLIDDAPNPGGVCLYRGCMPSKALLHVAKVLTDAKEAGEWGVAFGEPDIDLQRLREWKDGVIDKLTGGLGQLTSQRKVTYLQGRASRIEPTSVTVAIGDGATQNVGFDHAILATGSRPSRPVALAAVHPRILDSTDALDLKSVPQRLLVVGGGYIGLELGSVYAALGTDVTVVEMTGSLLPGVDADLVRVLARRFGKVASAVHLNTTVTELCPDETGVDVFLEGPCIDEPMERFDQVLVAVGRVPNSELPGLAETNADVDDRGFVTVDGQRRTGEASLFAIGDLAGEPMLAHKAFHEARVAVEAIAGRNVVFEPLAIPAVVFTDPEIAWCGVTESQAEEEGRTVAVAKFPWGASGRALTLGCPEGMTKLVIDPDSDAIVGVGIVGVGAAELIAEGVVAIEMGTTIGDLKHCIHPHPTLSETVLESAEAFLGLSTHIYKPKKA